MPKITYPRRCPKCGKSFSQGNFFRHKKRCGSFEHRVKCPWCPLTFGYKHNMHRHVKQQHSNNPLRFPCTICGKVLTRRHSSRVHMKTVHTDLQPCFCRWYCNATFTWKTERQVHMRKVHGRICRAQEVNFYLHLQHLSKEEEFQNKWIFVESRSIQRGEHNVCPCGQSPLHSYFFTENKWNGNRAFVGSTCVGNIDTKAGAVIGYFKHILETAVQENYKGKDNRGLQKFTVNSSTTLVKRLHVVEHLNPPLTRNTEGH